LIVLLVGEGTRSLELVFDSSIRTVYDTYPSQARVIDTISQS